VIVWFLEFHGLEFSQKGFWCDYCYLYAAQMFR